MSVLHPSRALIDRHPLPAQLIEYPEVIAYWIDSVVPSVTGAQSEDTSDIILAHLRRRGVSDVNIRVAFAKSKYPFRFSTRSGMIVATAPKAPPPNSISAPPPRDAQAMKFVATDLDIKFQFAEKNGDGKEMVRIAQILLSMLETWMDERVAARDRHEQVRAEIMRTAPNIQRVIRPLGPGEPPVPGPDGRFSRFRIVRTAPQVAPRRAR